MLYEKFEDGVEICWGFECRCVNHGDCDNCALLQGYSEFCESEDVR